MRIHYLQHVSFEGPGYIKTWAESNNYSLTSTRLFEDEKLPAPEDIDGLVVMGGPMGVYDDEAYPWLTKEKQFIDRCIGQQKKIMGICLGAQLIAEVLGADVNSMQQKEIGWFPLCWKLSARSHPLLDFLPKQQTVLHWHGDQFELPEGALHLADSKACANQGFLIDNHILGLQFHLEMTPAGLTELIEHGQDELHPQQPYIQSLIKMLNAPHFDSNNKVMAQLLNRFFD